MWSGFAIRIVVHAKALEDRISTGKKKGDLENTVVEMRVAFAFEHLDPFYKMRVMSYVTHRCFLDQYSKPKIPGKHARYNVLLGAKPKLSKEAEEYVEEVKEDYTTGWLYGRKTRVLCYNPKLITGNISDYFHVENRKETNDCLVHAVNYALRCAFFVHREQVVRLMQKKLKITLEEARAKKVLGGVPIKAFSNFAVVNGEALSLR